MVDQTTPNQQPRVPEAYQRAFDLVEKLFASGDEVGAKVRKIAKETFPDIRTPEETIDPVVNPLKAEVEALRKQISDDAKARADKEAADAATKQKTDLEAAINGARQKYHLTEDGFNKMVERMKSTGNYTDAEAAAAWVAAQEPPPAAPGPTFGPRNLDLKGNIGEEKVKLLHSDPEAYQDAELREFLADPDKYVRETMGEAA